MDLIYAAPLVAGGGILGYLVAALIRWARRYSPVPPHKPRRRPERRGEGISLLVPFKADHGEREAVWKWLHEYWKHELPGAQIVIGTDHGIPFSKTSAVNDAARRATGDIFVLLDADCYVPGQLVLDCAHRIRQSENPVWFIPYRRFYRLTERFSKAIRRSDPRCPIRVPKFPEPWMVEDTTGSSFGHWFGALIQIFPREAWEAVGGMDPRFRGWGGEDISFVRAMDTLWGHHKTVKAHAAHMWHSKIGETYETREWENQGGPMRNNSLSLRYMRAWGDPKKMRALVNESFE